MSPTPDGAPADQQEIIADLQSRLAACRAELDAALAREGAMSQVLGIINISPGNLAPVFDAILEKAQSLCGVAFYTLQLCDGGKFRAVALLGVADSFAAVLREPIDPVPGSPPSRLLAGEPAVQITDLAVLTQSSDARAAAAAAHGVRTLLFVPLRKQADLLGYITAFRNEAQPFSDNQIALFQNYAAQADIAMENARLINETHEA